MIPFKIIRGWLTPLTVKFLRKDVDQASAGKITAVGFDASGERITNVATATDNADAVNLLQMNTADAALDLRLDLAESDIDSLIAEDIALNTAIAQEIDDREAGDATLQTNITAEETARIAGDVAARARANHTGTQLASTISDFNTAVFFKVKVLAATTGNIVLSGLQTIDGVLTAAGSRYFVKNQTTASQNGIYLANSSGWTRVTDANTGQGIRDSVVIVLNGTTQANTLWMCTNTSAITIGSTAINFAQIAPPSVAYTLNVQLGTNFTTGTRDLAAISPRPRNSASVILAVNGQTQRNGVDYTVNAATGVITLYRTELGFDMDVNDKITINWTAAT